MTPGFVADGARTFHSGPVAAQSASPLRRGLIDKVPDADLEAAAASPDPRFFGIQGRVSRLADGRIGRFGWKAEHASLHGFVLTACAVELGLEVPGRHQGIKPDDPDYHSPGLDLSQEECNRAGRLHQESPRAGPAAAGDPARDGGDPIRPSVLRPDQLRHAIGRSSVRSMAFTAISCCTTWASRSATVPRTAFSVLPDPAEEQGPLADADFPAGPDAFAGEPQRARLPLRREWRTPPLWGLRDSAPYMHDGRAGDIATGNRPPRRTGRIGQEPLFQTPTRAAARYATLPEVPPRSFDRGARAVRPPLPDIPVHGPIFSAE